MADNYRPVKPIPHKSSMWGILGGPPPQRDRAGTNHRAKEEAALMINNAAGNIMRPSADHGFPSSDSLQDTSRSSLLPTIRKTSSLPPPPSPSVDDACRTNNNNLVEEVDDHDGVPSKEESAAAAAIPSPVVASSFSPSSSERIAALEKMLAQQQEELLDLRQQVNRKTTGVPALAYSDGPSTAVLANGLSHLKKEMDLRQQGIDQRVEGLGTEFATLNETMRERTVELLSLITKLKSESVSTNSRIAKAEDLIVKTRQVQKQQQQQQEEKSTGGGVDNSATMMKVLSEALTKVRAEMNHLNTRIDQVERIQAEEGHEMGDLRSGLNKHIRHIQGQIEEIEVRTEQAEALMVKAHQKGKEMGMEVSKDMRTLREEIRNMQEENQHVQEIVSKEGKLRSDGIKQLLEVVEHLKARISDAREQSNSDLTDAIGQLNLRFSRIHDDYDANFKDEREARMMSIMELEKNVVEEMKNMQEQFRQSQKAGMQQALEESKLGEEGWMSAIAKSKAAVKELLSVEANARRELAEELTKLTTEKLSAALKSTSRLNKSQSQLVDDVRSLMQLEVESRKNEQKSLQNAIATLARDWMDEFEAFRWEFRATSNAFETRIDECEDDLINGCTAQVEGIEETLVVQQSLQASANAQQREKLRYLANTIDVEKDLLRTDLKAITSTFEAIQKGHQDMEGQMKVMGEKLGADVNGQREALKELQASLEMTSIVADEAMAGVNELASLLTAVQAQQQRKPSISESLVSSSSSRHKRKPPSTSSLSSTTSLSPRMSLDNSKSSEGAVPQEEEATINQPVESDGDGKETPSAVEPDPSSSSHPAFLDNSSFRELVETSEKEFEERQQQEQEEEKQEAPPLALPTEVVHITATNEVHEEKKKASSRHRKRSSSSSSTTLSVGSSRESLDTRFQELVADEKEIVDSPATAAATGAGTVKQEEEAAVPSSSSVAATHQKNKEEADHDDGRAGAVDGDGDDQNAVVVAKSNDDTIYQVDLGGEGKEGTG